MKGLHLKRIVLLLFLSFVMISCTYNHSRDYDEKLEPVITRVLGITQYTEESEMLSLIQYRNEDDGLYYYEISFGYFYYPQNSSELTYTAKNAIFIIDHDMISDNGDFYFTYELELEEYKDVKNMYNLTISNYAPIASYNKEELAPITETIIEYNNYNN